jgi:phosphatidylglycerophosphatase A
MEIWERIKEGFLQLATMGKIGRAPFGGVLASLVALPLIFLGRGVYHVSRDVFYIALMVVVACVIVGLNFVRGSLSIDEHKTIVFNRIVGMAISLAFIPLDLRFVPLALLLFHGLRYFVPPFVERAWGVKLDGLPGALGLLGADAAAGIVTNVFLRVAMLFVR